MEYSSTFLPEVASEEGWDQRRTLRELLRKAGFIGSVSDIKGSFKVQRYESTVHTATFAEYKKAAPELEGLGENLT